MKNQHPTAVIYSRVSSHEQSKGLSLDSQVQTIRQFCETRSISIIKEFQDIMTGTKFDRDGFNALKEFCHKKRPTYILVWRWDRLGRNTIELLSTVKSFQKLGIEINSVEQWKGSDSADDNFMLGLQAILAERESKITSERARMSIRKGMESGLWLNKLPIGYRRSRTLDEKGKRSVEICPIGSVIVKEVFDLFLNDTSKMQIRQHILGTYENDLKEINYNFVKMAIRRILTNPLYLGKLIIKDADGEKLIDAKHEAIIEQAQFDAVQKKLRDTEGGRIVAHIEEREDYPLKGRLLCPQCFAPLRAYGVKKSLKKGTVQKIHYYDCKGSHYRIAAKKAHEIVESVMIELSLSEADKAKTMKIIKERVDKMLKNIKEGRITAQKDIDALSDKLTKLDDLLLTGLDIDTYKRMSVQIGQQLTDRKLELSSTNDFVHFREAIFKNALDMIVDLGEGYKSLSGHLQKKMVAALFPTGFFIEKNEEVILTYFLNRFVSVTRSESMKYKKLRLIESAEVPFCGVKGTEIEPKNTPIGSDFQLINTYIYAKIRENGRTGYK